MLGVQVEAAVYKEAPTRFEYSRRIGLAFDVVAFTIALRQAFGAKVKLNDAMK